MADLESHTPWAETDQIVALSNVCAGLLAYIGVPGLTDPTDGEAAFCRVRGSSGQQPLI